MSVKIVTVIKRAYKKWLDSDSFTKDELDFSGAVGEKLSYRAAAFYAGFLEGQKEATKEVKNVF